MEVAETADDGEGGTVIEGPHRTEDPVQAEVVVGVDFGEVAKRQGVRLPYHIAGLNKHTGAHQTPEGVGFGIQDTETYPRFYLRDPDTDPYQQE